MVSLESGKNSESTPLPDEKKNVVFFIEHPDMSVATPPRKARSEISLSYILDFNVSLYDCHTGLTWASVTDKGRNLFWKILGISFHVAVHLKLRKLEATL